MKLAGHAAGTILLIVRTAHKQLQRHSPAGHPRDVVLRGVPAAAQRHLYTDAVDARMVVSHNLRQPNALLHRWHTHSVRARRRAGQRGPSARGTRSFRYPDGHMGCGKLQEELVSRPPQ